MDLVTIGAIVGIVAGVFYIVETTYKYWPRSFKKIYLKRSRPDFYRWDLIRRTVGHTLFSKVWL